MKDIPIIINRKQPFQSIRRSRVLSPCVAPYPIYRTLTWPPLCTCTLSSHVALCFICVDWFSWPWLCCGHRENSSKPSVFSLSAAGCHTLRLLASLFLHFSSFFFFFLLLWGPWLHFQCVCTTVMFSSPGTERFMVNTLQKAEPGQSDVRFLLNKNFEWLQASGLHSYQPAFSFVLVTWYFMARSVVFTETTRPYSLDFMGFHWRFSRCVGFPLWNQQQVIHFRNCLWNNISHTCVMTPDCVFDDYCVDETLKSHCPWNILHDINTGSDRLRC